MTENLLRFLKYFCQILEDAVRPDTILVSIMAVNNEIGVKQRIKEIG